MEVPVVYDVGNLLAVELVHRLYGRAERPGVAEVGVGVQPAGRMPITLWANAFAPTTAAGKESSFDSMASASRCQAL